MQLESLASLVFHRVGGLDLTVRFKEGELPVVSDIDFAEDAPAVRIVFSSGSALEETPATVRAFTPRSGDVTGRRYTDFNGTNRWVNLPPYALTDPASYRTLIRAQIPENALVWAANQGSAARREAVRLIDFGVAPELETLLQYDFGRFQKTRSAFIVGESQLGIPALPSNARGLGGKTPLPRTITAQCDVVLTAYLDELLQQIFADPNSRLLQRILSSSDAMDTHVAYVALRIITEGTLWVLADKQRRDLQNNSRNYTLQAQLQDNLNIIVRVFCSRRFGTDYRALRDVLDREAGAFYHAIEHSDDVFNPEWQNPLVWLPTLHDVVTKPFEPQYVFHRY